MPSTVLSLRLFLVMMPMLGFVGCSRTDPELFPVHGVVRFPDGKLLRSGTVELETIGREDPVTATAVIEPDGTFVMGTRTADDGAIVGTHRVVVISDYEIGNGAERPGLIPLSILDSKYRSFRTSDLEVVVEPRSNSIILDVEYAAHVGASQAGS